MPTSKRKSRFFITHSFKDLKFARRLASDLRKRGLDGFFDIYSIKPGENIAERVGTGLEECDVYVPVMSLAALGSLWCREEVNCAITLSNELGRGGRPRIIPVLLEDCQKELPVFLRSRLYLNFEGHYDEAFKELLEKGFGLGTVEPKRLTRKKSKAKRLIVKSPAPRVPTRKKPKAKRSIVESPEPRVPSRGFLSREQLAQLVDQAKRHAPNMTWGMIGGKEGRALKIFPLKNVHFYPRTYYAADPKELLKTVREIEEEKGWEIVSIYCSYPTTEAYPSGYTVANWHYIDSIHMIISLRNPEQAVVRGFRIVDGHVTEVAIDVE